MNIVRVAARLARTAVRHGWQLRTESAVAVLNLSTVAASFILQIVVLRMAGASRDADAYFATAAIPQMALSIAVHVVTGALLPLLARIDEQTRSATVWTMLALIMVVGGPVALTLWFSAPWWTFVIFPGFSSEAVPASVALAGLAALTTPFAIATCVLSGNLYAQRRFLTNESIALATSVGLSLAAALLIPRYGIVVLGWLVLARFAIQATLLCLFLPVCGVRFANSALAVVLRRARALFAGALYFKADLLVDRFLLSLAPAGALSIVVFGQSVFAAASGVLGQSLANTASPTLSLAHDARDGREFRAVLQRNLALITSASLLLLVASVVLIPPIASLMTTHAISRSGVSLRWVLILFGGVPVGACVGALLANAFYAMGDTRTPTVMTALTFTVFLAAKIVVFTYFGMYAFCALTSIYYLCNGGILAWLLRRKIRLEFGP